MNILETTPVYTSKFLNMNVSAYKNQKGKKREWTWAERPNGTHAVVIAAICDSKLVVIREFRVPINDYEWGLPAGLIEKGENVTSATVRELKEETGLDVVRFLKPNSPLVYNSPGLTNEGCYMSYVLAQGDTSDAQHEDSEDITVHLLTPEDVQKLMDHPDVKIGAKAYLVFDRFCKYRDI